MALHLNYATDEVFIPQNDTHATPPSGFVIIYAKTDGNMYAKNHAGVESSMSGGGGGSFPANQIVYGTGSGSSSDADFTWDFATKTLSLGDPTTSPTIRTPDGVASDGTNLQILAGSGNPIDATTQSTGGFIAITAGGSSARRNGGNVEITGGNLDNDVGGGKVTPIHAGHVTLLGGTLSNSVDGSSTVQSSPGDVTIIGGSNTQTDGTGGDANIFGGAGVSGDGNGGNVNVATNSAANGGSGGFIVMTTGSATTGDAGSLDVQCGFSGTGQAGGIFLHTGYITAAGAGIPGNLDILTLGGYITYSTGDFRNRPPENDVLSALTRQYLLRAITTNNTPTEMFLDGTVSDVNPTNSRKLVLSNNSAWKWEVHIIAHRTDTTGENAAFQYAGSISRDANAASTALVGTVQTIMTPQAVGLTVTVAITADTTNGSLKIAVTGEAAKTIRWVAYVRSVEVTNAV